MMPAFKRERVLPNPPPASTDELLDLEVNFLRELILDLNRDLAGQTLSNKEALTAIKTINYARKVTANIKKYRAAA